MSALRKGCQLFKQTYEPRFVFVIGTKRHFKKFFVKTAGGLENMKPCSVVSKKFVREDCPELFMQSHYPLKVRSLPTSAARSLLASHSTSPRFSGCRQAGGVQHSGQRGGDDARRIGGAAQLAVLLAPDRQLGRVPPGAHLPGGRAGEARQGELQHHEVCPS